MLTIAFEIGLKPNEFWAMTPYEFKIAIKANSKIKEYEKRLTAWATAHIINCWTKTPVSVDELCGIEKIDFKGMTPDEIKQYFKEQKELKESSEG